MAKQEYNVIYEKDDAWTVYVPVPNPPCETLYDWRNSFRDEAVDWLNERLGELRVDWIWYADIFNDRDYVMYLACNDPDVALQFKLTWC